jgi:hypothetical protein
MVSSSDMRRAPRGGLPALAEEIRNLWRAVKALQGGAPLRQAGIRVADTGMTIESALAVLGALSATGDTELGGDVDISGDTTVSGTLTVSGLLSLLSDMVVSGVIRSENFAAGASGWRLTSTGLEVNDLTLRGGIIGNDALANPITGRSGNAMQTQITLPTASFGGYAAVNVAVPAGFTRAEVLAVSSCFVGSSTSSNAAAMKTRINGADGLQMTVVTDPIFGNGASSFSASLSGLSGGVITCQTMLQATAAGMTGGCTTSALVTFYR